MSGTNLLWSDGTPTSEIFGDIYFSREDGMEETRHVFLNSNNLPQRWQTQSEPFTIIETGFGTGLNFFTALKLWQEKPDFPMHFISIEKYPLAGSDIRQAISTWPELVCYFDEFLPQYNPQENGQSYIKMFGGKICVTIIFKDVKDALNDINTTADAWFLDGFAPAKNPDMWCDELFSNMRRLSKENTTFATFTAAGFVKRGLQNNGFNVEKIAGFGRKREMLCGIFNV